MKEQENAYRHSHRENRIRELEVVKYRVSERINHTNSTIKRGRENPRLIICRTGVVIETCYCLLMKHQTFQLSMINPSTQSHFPVPNTSNTMILLSLAAKTTEELSWRTEDTGWGVERVITQARSARHHSYLTFIRSIRRSHNFTQWSKLPLTITSPFTPSHPTLIERT